MGGGEAWVGEAWVFTAPAHGRLGLASALLGAWSRVLGERGCASLVSPRCDDLAACALADGLGLGWLAEDRWWR